MTIEEKIKAYPVEVWDRVVGWFSERGNMNLGKQSEKKDLIRYKFDLTKKK
jgi:hypothetical protein